MLSSVLTTTDERRQLPLATAGVSIRAVQPDNEDEETAQERFVGYAAVFNQRTAIGNPLRWGFYEEVAPGCFTKTLTEGDARFLIDHDSYYVVSRVSADTLDLAQDKVGLSVDSALDPALYYVEALKANVRNKNVTGMSFGFYVVKDAWATEIVETNDGNSADVEVRTLLEVRLVEVSAVTFPAYPQTSAELKAVAAALVRRGDQQAIEQRAQYRPELLELCGLSSGQTGRSLVVPGCTCANRTVTTDHANPDPVDTTPDQARTVDEGTETTLDSEPAETTRDEVPQVDDTAADEPVASTRKFAPSITDRMAALSARYGLPRTPTPVG